MKKLSSDWTFFNKKVFPTVFLGITGAFFISDLWKFATREGNPDMGMLFGSFFLVTIGLVISVTLLWDLVDEVYDEGDSLLIVNRKKKKRIELSEIKNIHYSFATSPPRVTIYTKEKTEFGERITFCPPFGQKVFEKTEAITQLINRIEANQAR